MTPTLPRTHKGRPVLDSTDTARMLRLHPHDPLYRRYDLLHANGALRPVTLEPVPLFDLEAVRRLSGHVAPIQIDGADDPLRPARGIGLAIAVSLLALTVTALGVAAIIRVVR